MQRILMVIKNRLHLYENIISSLFLYDFGMKLGESIKMRTSVSFEAFSGFRHTCVCVFRQNRRVRFDQKKWSHIAPSLITPLDDKERNHFSLRVKPSVLLSVCLLLHVQMVCVPLSVTLSVSVCVCVS